MKSRVVFFAVLALVLFVFAAPQAEAQNYVNGAKYKKYTQANVNSGEGYRTLRLTAKSDLAIDNIGYMQLLKANTPGDPNIIEIVSV